ncbi:MULTISPECIES: hypothetical protein [Rhodonellum]|nr:MULTISPECIES: hypothetical protein [Rhodonellum]
MKQKISLGRDQGRFFFVLCMGSTWTVSVPDFPDTTMCLYA